MLNGAAALEGLLRRDRAVVITALCAVVILSWLYLVASAGMESHEMDGMTMPMMRAEWSPAYFAVMVAMWAVMMAAMMLPSAAPMILFHATISRRRQEQNGTLAATGLFVLGYVAVWAGFSLAASTLQWALASAVLLSPMMEITSKTVAAALLVAAGIYQWTPLKHSCLRRCRSPLDFVLAYWREGNWGSFAMGLRHGAFCLGCCGVLMLLLFVGGLMNLAWVAGLAAFILIEKAAPRGDWIGRFVGLGLVLWGLVDLLRLV
jgi:predicted metal-binding membrane protein